jgi:pathogenicity locus Cdd1 protein
LSDSFKTSVGSLRRNGVMSETELRALPNVGPAVAGMLMRAGIQRPEDMRGKTAEQLYRRLCRVDGRRHDPCLLDTLVAVVDYLDGAPPRPWWYYSRLRIDAEWETVYAFASDQRRLGEWARSPRTCPH